MREGAALARDWLTGRSGERRERRSADGDLRVGGVMVQKGLQDPDEDNDVEAGDVLQAVSRVKCSGPGAKDS